MRVEPEYGQDIPVECASARITQGNAEYRIIDRGTFIEIMLLQHKGHLADGLMVNGQASNVIRIAPGRML